MATYQSFSGIITRIDNFPTGDNKSLGCYKLISIIIINGSIVNFVVTPSTYFIDNEMLSVGNYVIGFYDENVPVPLIYPPQFQAVVMAKVYRSKNIKVDYFNSQLISSDGSLKLNIAPWTQIILENGQNFIGNPSNRILIVVYGPTTKSIPAQTTPYQIIVMCR